MNIEKKTISRKKFFGTLGKGAVVVAIASMLPFNLFAKKEKKSKNKIDIKIHPSAVRRNK